MNEGRDSTLACADCGASFAFTAAEAAVFADRGLSTPKRCKDCRRARKAGAAQGGDARGAAGRHGSGNGYDRAPRYTGNVNEYRSPMQDTRSPRDLDRPFQHGSPPRRARPEGRPGPGQGAFRHGERPPRRVGPRGAGAPGDAPPARTGEYRSPMQDRPAPARESRPPRDVGRARDHVHVDGDGAGKKRKKGPTFPITCSSCSQQAEVPFKPAEGRDVFCPECFKARRAIPADQRT